MRHPVWALPTFGLLIACSAPEQQSDEAESIEISGDFSLVGEDSWQCSSRVELSSLWTEVRKRHDLDGDGQVTSLEYTRGERRFANYDRNGDGVLDETDFPEDTHFNGFNHMILRYADTDENEEVSAEEWTAFQASLDGNGDGRVEKEEVQEGIGGWTNDWPLFLLSFDQDGDGDFDEVDLATTFRDQDYNGDGVLAGAEMRGWQTTMEYGEGEPPAAGEDAPIFALPFAHDPMKLFRLDDPERKRPVALIFGSYT